MYFGNRSYANPIVGVKGEWFCEILGEWMPIINYETKRYIYERFFKGGYDHRRTTRI